MSATSLLQRRIPSKITVLRVIISLPNCLDSINRLSFISFRTRKSIKNLHRNFCKNTFIERINRTFCHSLPAFSKTHLFRSISRKTPKTRITVILVHCKLPVFRNMKNRLNRFVNPCSGNLRITQSFFHYIKTSVIPLVIFVNRTFCLKTHQRRLTRTHKRTNFPARQTDIFSVHITAQICPFHKRISAFSRIMQFYSLRLSKNFGISRRKKSHQKKYPKSSVFHIVIIGQKIYI